MNTPSAKSIVVSIIAVILVLSIFSWFPSPETKDIVRFFLNCVLCWFLFKGKNWARWIMVILLTLAGTMVFFVMVTSPQDMEKAIVLYVVSFSYLVSAALLVFSKAVAGYFETPSIQKDS